MNTLETNVLESNPDQPIDYRKILSAKIVCYGQNIIDANTNRALLLMDGIMTVPHATIYLLARQDEAMQQLRMLDQKMNITDPSTPSVSDK